MRTSLLLLFALFSAGLLRAQNLSPDYYNEIGIYAGIAPFSQPNGPLYKGDRKKIPFLASLNYHYNLTENWQIGLDASMTKWESTGPQSYNDLNGAPLASESVKYVYADRVWALTARINRVEPHYDQFHLNRSNFYYGIAVGAIATLNDASVTYSQVNGTPGEQYRYMSEYHYEAGAGYTFGLQAGYNFYVGAHFGFNAELAPRFAHVNVVDYRIGSRNASFNELYFPLTLGIRLRF